MGLFKLTINIYVVLCAYFITSLDGAAVPDTAKQSKSVYCGYYADQFRSCSGNLTKELNIVVSELDTNALAQAYRRTQNIVRWAHACEAKAADFDNCCELQGVEQKDENGPSELGDPCNTKLVEEVENEVTQLSSSVEAAAWKAIARIFLEERKP